MKIRDFCKKFCKGGNVKNGPDVGRILFTSTLPPANRCEDDESNVWFEYFFEDGRFGIVYDRKVNKESSWYMVDTSFKISDIRHSCSGYLDEEGVRLLYKYITMEPV